MPRISRIGGNADERGSPSDNRQTSEALTANPTVGRGWETHPHLVTLEPELHPHSRKSTPIVPFDDGRIPNRFARLFARRQPDRSSDVGERKIPVISSSSDLEVCPEELTSIRAFLPAELRIVSSEYQQLIASLANSAELASFEIIGTHQSIVFQITSGHKDHLTVLSHLRNHLPQIDFRVAEDELGKLISPNDGDRCIAVDVGLSSHWFLPIRMGKELSADPIVPLLAILDNLGESETVCFQLMFARTRNRWQREAANELFDDEGKARFANLRSTLSEVKSKLSAPLFLACPRILVSSDQRDRSIRIARQVGVYIKQFGAPERNALIPLRSDDLDPKRHLKSVLTRSTFRSGMLLSLDELSGLIRFPTDAIRSEKLERDKNRTKAAPESAINGDVVLGENVHAGQTRLVRAPSAAHGLIIGGTGTGKSTLLLRILTQHLESGNGFCLVEPHGDLVDEVLARVPERRLNDVILFDPADSNYPIGFNFLQANSETEKTFLASDLVATFRRFSASWGDVMDAVLANAVLAFVESSRGGTLSDLKKFLVEKDFRNAFLETVTDESVRYFWTHEFPLISGRTQSSILIRLDTFLRQKLIRNIVCQKESKLDLRKIFDERKILLVRLAEGLIGEENASLLGTLILSKIYQIALTRQDSGITDRSLWPVFIDEAPHFAGNPSMSLILANLRKFGISLTLATQSYKQLMLKDAGVADSVLANCQTRICFRLGDMDADKLANGFSFFDAKALQNLGTGEAIVRFEKAENDFNLKTFRVDAVAPNAAEARKLAIIEHTRKSYAKPRNEVETELRVLRPNNTSAEKHPEPKNVENQSSTSNVKKTRSDAETEADSSHSQHRYLQNIVKRIGEDKGFIATIEKQVFGGIGKVDVALENASIKIACEIAVTNTTDYEVLNIQKCLTSGFDRMVVISPDRRHLENIRKRAELILSPVHLDRVHFLEPENFHLFLESLPNIKSSDDAEPPKVKGYKVITIDDEIPRSEADAKKSVIRDLISRVIRRRKRGQDE